MTSYAAQKGRAATVAQPVSRQASAPLTEAEEARIAENRDLILEHMPEMLPIIRNLHAEGLIDGWRSFARFALLDGGHD
jgi:hypothetical protein